MKLLVRYVATILGVLCLWTTFFGFNSSTDGIQLVPSAYAQQEGKTCGGEDCATYCRGENADSVECKEYKQGRLGSLANTLDQVLSFLYLIMRPLLYVAGLAMDNTLIYGEGLGLTALLYQFWTIMRTLANFVIVLILLWSIGAEMFKWSDSSPKAMGKLVLTIILSGVLINFSWFLIGIAVDVSTIATYGVGALPLKLEGGNEQYCVTDDEGVTTLGSEAIDNIEDVAKLGTCRPILATHGTMNLSDTFSAESAQWKVYYSYENKSVAAHPKTEYFLSCPFKHGELAYKEWETFVQAFVSGGTYTTNGVTGSIIETDKKVKEYFKSSTSAGRQYCVVGTNQLLKVNNTSITMGSTGYYNAIVGGVSQLHSWNGLRVRNLVDSHKGMVGVLYTMYGNMLGFANIKTDVQTNSNESQIIQFLVKGFFGFAIVFPLIALCIILVMRVAVLWMVIGFSPLLILGWTMRAMGIKSERVDSIMKKLTVNDIELTLENVINLLVQPVIIVFTISMGMMFLDALGTTLTADNGFGEALQCPPSANGQQCCSVVEVVNICFEKVNAQVGTDAFFNYFTFAITNIVGVMVLWFMVFAIMKSSKITESAVSKIQGLGRSIMGSMPVIPWFDGNFVGVDGAKDGLSKAWDIMTESPKDKTGETITQPWVDHLSDQVTGAVGGARQNIIKTAGEGVKTDDIAKSADKRTEFGKKLIDAMGKAKGTVQHSTANELLDTKDKNVQALLGQYSGATDALSLLSHPQFLADTGKKSSEMAELFAPKNATWETTQKAKKQYLDTVKKSAEKIELLSSGGDKAVYTHEGKKIFFKKTINKDETIDIAPLGVSLPNTSQVSYAQLKPVVDLKLTPGEFSKLGVSSTSVDGWKQSDTPKEKNIVEIEVVKAPEPAKPSVTTSGTTSKGG